MTQANIVMTEPRISLPVPAECARPIRICYVIDRLARAGTESQLLALIERLDRSRVEPMLCLLDGESDESLALEPDCCPVYRLGVRSLHHPRTVRQALRLAYLLCEHQVDVVQVYFPDSTLFGVLVARLAGVRCIVRTRNNLGYSLTRTQRWLGRFCNRFVTATVANCEACRQAVLAQERPAIESVMILENGVDLSRFSASDSDMSLGEVREKRFVGMVANLRPVKEPGVLVQAARIVVDAHADVRFHLAGDGPLRADLEEQIAELGLQGHVELAGAVADVPAFLAGLDVAVLCSRSEGQSNALLEYMAAGRALVATDVGGNRELIERGIHGLLVPPGNPKKLADAILQLLKDPPLAARLGAAARRRVEERYSLEARARRFEEFYEQLASFRGAATR